LKIAVNKADHKPTVSAISSGIRGLKMLDPKS